MKNRTLKLKNIIKAGDLVKETYVNETTITPYYNIHLVFRLTSKGKMRLNDLDKTNRSYNRDYYVSQGASALYLYVIEHNITEVYRKNKETNNYDLYAYKDYQEKGWHLVNE